MRRHRDDREIDWEWEGSRPSNRDEEPDPTDAGYDQAAHRGARYGFVEGRGGVFGTSGGGTYAGGFQVENRFGTPRGDWERESRWEGSGPETASFRGRGPRNYRRPAERILEEVHHRLEDDGWVDATDIEVSIDGGDVTLAGRVETREMRRRAEELVESVPGVEHVRNDVRVRR